MHRRDFLATTVVAGSALLMARAAIAKPATTLTFRPTVDLAFVDPMATTASSTRYLAHMSYDTLYGLNNRREPQPQMVAGHQVEDGGLTWRLTLREGLRFHDGAPVLASDAVASIRRWCQRDAFGQVLQAATADLSAPSDKQILFRLRYPFPLLPTALAKTTLYVPVIMPARLIADPAKTVSEVVGSGPFRFLPGEQLAGSRYVWERFDGYVPRDGGPPEFTSGPKIAKVDRVEWHYIPDESTAANALATGEIDWYEDLVIDLIPIMQRNPNVVVGSFEPNGRMGIVRLNHLHPPFDNPAIRQALLGAVDQSDVMSAIAGTDRTHWDDKVGIFCPESPYASEVGMAPLDGPRDYDKVRRALQAAGYRGERVTHISPAPSFALTQQDNVVADQFKQAGLNVDLIPLDFGTWLQRRNNTDTPEKGGWNVLSTTLFGEDLWDPASHAPLRSNGLGAWPGWPTDGKLEALREQWFKETDPAAARAICQDMQREALQTVTYIPTGRYKSLTAYRRNLKGMLTGTALFHNIEKT